MNITTIATVFRRTACWCVVVVMIGSCAEDPVVPNERWVVKSGIAMVDVIRLTSFGGERYLTILAEGSVEIRRECGVNTCRAQIAGGTFTATGDAVTRDGEVVSDVRISVRQTSRWFQIVPAGTIATGRIDVHVEARLDGVPVEYDVFNEGGAVVDGGPRYAGVGTNWIPRGEDLEGWRLISAIDFDVRPME